MSDSEPYATDFSPKLSAHAAHHAWLSDDALAVLIFVSQNEKH
jgi:hypothetical protein